MRSLLETYLSDKLLLLSAMDLAMLLKLLVIYDFLFLTLCLLDVPADKPSPEKVLYTYLHG